MSFCLRIWLDKMDAKVETLELKKGNKLNSCKENDAEEKWKQHARARARARCVTPSDLCCKARSLVLHYGEYYVSFDAEAPFAFIVFGATFFFFILPYRKRRQKV